MTITKTMTMRWVVLALASVGCVPGYIKPHELEAQGQGPAACSKSCEDMGMRMTAMVLVGDTLPGCVCQPVTKQEPASAPPPPSSPASQPPPPSTSPSPATEAAEPGAAAATTGFVVVAAAAAAAQQQQAQFRRQQQQQQQHHTK